MRTTVGANWNIVALADLCGSIVERYVYTPYGEQTPLRGRAHCCFGCRGITLRGWWVARPAELTRWQVNHDLQ